MIFEDTTINRIVFHFNKAHLTDSTIPMWTIKHKGVTYYVNHVESEIGWRTKETPDNEATKGSIQLKGAIQIFKNGEEITARIYNP